MMMPKPLLLLPLLLAIFAPTAYATYSIVACDSQTRQCGVAVQTNNLAVGASVPYAQAGVGALASQFETNPRYGPRGLALLSEGKSPDETLKQLLREDGFFDGEGTEARQVGIVALDGRATFFTGQDAASSNWAGGHSGKGYSIQGNGLAGPQVAEAMEQAFLKTQGPLADRLMAALVAGDAAGGQRTGRESAALLVRTPNGFPMDIDLRVDHASDPVAELQTLYNMQCARQRVIDAGIAARKGQFEQSRTLMISAVARASGWARVWIRAAKVAEQIEERPLALQYVTMAFSENPAWVQQEIGSGEYAELGAEPMFHRWVTAEQEQRALSAYRELHEASTSSAQDYVRVARILLEVGHPHEALTMLEGSGGALTENVALGLARAEAYAATGDYANSLKEYQKASAQAPNDLRIRLRLRQLRQSTDGPPNTQ
jgi:uncharacterized Ntn-hydrolase superfamily protein/predicted negative regulator of RcsB-dependent stress response